MTPQKEQTSNHKKNKRNELDRLCKCGHRKGEHTYHEGSFCTRVLSCGCKRFIGTERFEKK